MISGLGKGSKGSFWGEKESGGAGEEPLVLAARSRRIWTPKSQIAVAAFLCSVPPTCLIFARLPSPPTLESNAGTRGEARAVV